MLPSLLPAREWPLSAINEAAKHVSVLISALAVGMRVTVAAEGLILPVVTPEEAIQDQESPADAPR